MRRIEIQGKHHNLKGRREYILRQIKFSLPQTVYNLQI